MNIIFGPVRSRRLGRSLGLDIIPFKTCPFDCVYCECGATTLKTVERKPYIPADTVLKELAEALSKKPELDYITFSGSGEPTLNSDIACMITGIKEMTDIPIAVLTNSSLLMNPDVRKDLLEADLVVPSLDAASDAMFKMIDRPPQDMKIEDVLQGIIKFRSEFKGKLWLEILFIEAFNTRDSEVLLLKKAVERIKPDRLQLNTVDRPPLFDWVQPVPGETMRKIRTVISFEPADIIIREV
jgi:wyosine [tRNA(Phe)-imidazoG37] synthetase (radical SAM superfamily)